MWARAARLAAAGSLGAVMARATSCAAEGTTQNVTFDERAPEHWIEVSQRKLADSLADWTTMEYESSLAALRAAYRFPVGVMHALKSHFLSEASLGLAGQPSSLRMLPSFVNQRVTGDEAGHFYALDLGGTNFRVLRVPLEGGGVVGPIKSARFEVPKAIKEGTREELFGFLADSVATFLAKECGGNIEGDLGFTFSFPITQSAINEGKLIVWNKGFSAKDCVGNDVVQPLQEAFFARGMNLKVKALANDTVGTMEAAAYSRPNTAMGVIIGTGTNAAYIEKTANVGKWRGAPCEEMVINTEWGNLDMRRFMNKFDMRVDSISDEPGAQTFEKMISGMYLGELFRLTITDPQVSGGFSSACKAALGSAFAEKASLPTKLMSTIEGDTSPNLSAAQKALAEKGVVRTTLRDRVLLREACVCISTRAARLSAVGIGSLLEMVPESSEGCTIAVDGTVFECYPYFKERMEAGLEELLGEQRARSIQLVGVPYSISGLPVLSLVDIVHRMYTAKVLAKDGSGLGAAIIAAIAKSP